MNSRDPATIKDSRALRQRWFKGCPACGDIHVRSDSFNAMVWRCACLKCGLVEEIDSAPGERGGEK